jgi:ribosome-binding protein aMBF1 (putative translation factor)
MYSEIEEVHDRYVNVEINHLRRGGIDREGHNCSDKPAAEYGPSVCVTDADRLQHLGDHIRKKRLDLGLFQRQVADKIWAHKSMIWNWESNATTPRVGLCPGFRVLGP